ncbi:MAG: ornithine cyclodeaminase family protein [Alphaproteobacteria bacterium]|nr:ornithine cyclodeaminase family protein [Alphaproteobacteria bacterium]
MTDDATASSPGGSNAAYLLLHPEDLDGLVGMEEAVDAVEKAYGEAATWPVVNAPRRRIHSPDGVRFSCFPGGVPELGVIGVVEHAERVVQEGPIQHTVDLEHQICVLHDSQDSKLLAVLVGSIPERLVGYTARTALRTGATSGVGFRHLARQDAATCGLIGAGNQAVTQLLALKAVRPIERVRVHTRSPEHREQFAATYGPLFGLEIVPVDTPEAAVAGADVVICATNTNQPVLFGEWLEPGQHVTSIVGSNIALVKAGWLDEPRRELDDAAVMKADRIAVNSREQVIQDEQGDLFGLISSGALELEDIAELGELANGTRPGRSADDEITLHKNNAGTGAADIAIAMAAYRAAKHKGQGRWIELAPITET